MEPSTKKSTAKKSGAIGAIDVKSLESLSLLLAPKTLEIDLNEIGTPEEGRTYPVLRFRVRPLSDAQWTQALELQRSIQKMPPVIQQPPPRPGEPPAPVRYNEDDPEYRKRVEEAFVAQQAFVLRCALVDIDLPPGHADCAKQLSEKLPPRLITALYAAVRALTDQPVPLANFI